MILGYSNLWTCQLASDWKEYENMTTSSSDFRPPILNSPSNDLKAEGGRLVVSETTRENAGWCRQRSPGQVGQTVLLDGFLSARVTEA